MHGPKVHPTPLGAAGRWRRRLAHIELRTLRFMGGVIHVPAPGEPGAVNGDGIQYVAKDFVAVARRESLYLVPYAALVEVEGERAREPHPLTRASLWQVVRGWVDLELDPDDPSGVLWHSFITRSGRSVSGAILDSTPEGVLLRLKGARMVQLRWSDVGAAVELLD